MCRLGNRHERAITVLVQSNSDFDRKLSTNLRAEGLYNDFTRSLFWRGYTYFSLRLHYLEEAGKEGHAEAIPLEPA